MTKSPGRRSLRRGVEKRVFNFVLHNMAAMARDSRTSWCVEPAMKGLATLTRWTRGGAKGALSGESLGHQWQRMMPTKNIVPITGIEDGVVHAEIRVECPLRGTGDAAACHRMMAYDRELLRPHDARFVVVQSQVEPGVSICRVALEPNKNPP